MAVVHKSEINLNVELDENKEIREELNIDSENN